MGGWSPFRLPLANLAVTGTRGLALPFSASRGLRKLSRSLTDTSRFSMSALNPCFLHRASPGPGEVEEGERVRGRGCGCVEFGSLTTALESRPVLPSAGLLLPGKDEEVLLAMTEGRFGGCCCASLSRSLSFSLLAAASLSSLSWRILSLSCAPGSYSFRLSLSSILLLSSSGGGGGGGGGVLSLSRSRSPLPLPLLWSWFGCGQSMRSLSLPPPRPLPRNGSSRLPPLSLGGRGGSGPSSLLLYLSRPPVAPFFSSASSFAASGFLLSSS